MFRYEGEGLGPVTYALVAGGGVIIATLPLAHLFSIRILIISVIISLIIAALLGISASIAETASFFAAYLLSLTSVALFSANEYPLQENTMVAVLPGVFAAFRPHWALAGFGFTLLLLLQFSSWLFITEISSIFLYSAAVSVGVRHILTYLLYEAGALIKDHRALLFRVFAILFMFYVMTTLYFASVYQLVSARDATAFSYMTNPFAPTFVDFFCYAAMITTHGATNFISPSSLAARFTTTIHMLVSYGFTTLYLATAVSIIAGRPGRGHAP